MSKDDEEVVLEKPGISSCVTGFTHFHEPKVSEIGGKLKRVCEKQEKLGKQVSDLKKEIAFFKKGKGSDDDKQESKTLSDMLEKTSFYHDKLVNLKKDMKSLSEKSGQLKLRSEKLQIAKEKEALNREMARVQELEREEALVAKP